ncbi:MAG: HEAT repeat domain-containing protein [Halodesulfurarchaeum sp.]
MDDGDEEPEEAPDETAADPHVAEFEERLDGAAQALEEAETEPDLDEVEATLDDIEGDLEEADIPVEEPEEEDEEPADPKEDLEDRLADLRDALEEQRGPYAEDVIDEVEAVKGTIANTRWAAEGEDELVPGVEEYLDAVADLVEGDFGTPVPDPEELASLFDEVVEAVEAADLDPDDDAAVIQDLLDATAEASDAVEAATAWDDLEVREQLKREGFYEPLEGSKHKDFPPEWSALKEWESRNEPEMAVLLLEKMGDSDFIARHCIDALKGMGSADGLQPLIQRANRRNLNAIDAIGKIGDEAGLNAVSGHAESEGDPELQKTALKAVGAIGSEESTETVAQQLMAESEKARSQAARSLGLIGDTRAIEPLSEVLADAEETATVRASAAWALYQIGTERALEVAAEYADDPAYPVEVEATKAEQALEATVQPA